MAKTKMICPFTHELCDECAVYRGRHYYLSLCQQYRGYIAEPKAKNQRVAPRVSGDFSDLQKLVEPRIKARSKPAAELEVRLKVIDMGSGEARSITLNEAKTWDWRNPEIARIVDGIQITSWEKLVAVLSRKADKGYKEVAIYEAPRFML
jgi:hypothetical protein